VTPQSILDHLLGTAPLNLHDLPIGQGIYALYDHEGVARYIGITEMGLRKRIHQYHSGGDGNSHKFSTVYNAGRMFHTRKDARTDPADGPISKELRRIFSRTYCKAVGLELPDQTKTELLAVETEVRRIAPPEALSWNDARQLPATEPADLVDKLLQDLNWPTNKIEAIDRQSTRWHGPPE
jgi:hypothetical protein